MRLSVLQSGRVSTLADGGEARSPSLRQACDSSPLAARPLTASRMQAKPNVITLGFIQLGAQAQPEDFPERPGMEPRTTHPIARAVLADERPQELVLLADQPGVGERITDRRGEIEVATCSCAAHARPSLSLRGARSCATQPADASPGRRSAERAACAACALSPPPKQCPGTRLSVRAD